MSKAILLAVYGSRNKNALKALEHIQKRIAERWPGVPQHVAYTSRSVRGHMARRGEDIDGPKEALERLLRDGYKRIALQSLHIIPGSEFHNLLPLANRYMVREGGFERVEVGFPLLAGEDDLELVCDAILSVMPERKSDSEAILLMGHGTLHPGNDFYEALHNRLQEKDPWVHLAAAEAEPGIEGIIEEFGRRKITKAHLLPFLFGAGWHVSKDMVGDNDQSWKSRLEAAGVECEPVLKGAGEYDALVKIWLDHLNDAMIRLERR